jgi:hypothetical protein
MTTTLTPAAPTAGANDVPAKPILNPSNPGKAADPVDPPGNPAQKEPPTKNPEAPVEVPSERKEGVANEKRDAAEYLQVLKLPADSKLEPAVLERIAANASAQGLSNEAAQSQVDLLHQEVASHLDAALKAHQPGGAEWTKTVEGWRAETMNDASLGKTVDERKAAIQKGVDVIRKYGEIDPAGKQAFVSFLDDSGLGDHPAAVRFFAHLGKMMGETPPVRGEPAGSGPKTTAELFYGTKPEQPSA